MSSDDPFPKSRKAIRDALHAIFEENILREVREANSPNAGPKVQCAKCGDIIQSKFRHDFVACKCRAIFIDGGGSYTRTGGKIEDILFLKEKKESG